VPEKKARVQRVTRTLQMRQITFLVKRSLLQTEAMHDIDNCLSRIFYALLFAALSRRITANIEGFTANVDLLAVSFVGDTVDFFDWVRVGDDLVVRD
jgi:hypothetical protein